MLTKLEDWLYDDGEDCEKSVYKTKLDELQKVGEPCKKRKYEAENRQSAIEGFGLSLQLSRKMVDMFANGDEKYNHLDKEEVAKVQKAIDENAAWMDKHLSTLAKQKKWEEPAVLISQIQSQKSAFESTCKPIMSKPKPKVEPPPPAAAPSGQESDKSKADSSKEGADVDMKEGQVNGGSDSSKDTPAPKDTTMEVD